MAKRKHKKKTPRTDPVARFLRPTGEREAHNDFRSVGVAVVVVPVIVRLHEAGLINDEEFSALAYYRDQAGLADKSPTRSCIDFSPKGGEGPGIAIASAIRETARIESNMGELRALCRAVCVDDVTLKHLCADDPKRIAMAVLELKYAAGGIVR